MFLHLKIIVEDVKSHFPRKTEVRKLAEAHGKHIITCADKYGRSSSVIVVVR